MSEKPADIFTQCEDLEEFYSRIIELNGQFDFLVEDMVSLGEEYFIKYPDTFARRNYDNIHTGYRLMRLCMLEKVMNDFDDRTKEIFREGFGNLKRIRELFPAYCSESGTEKVQQEVLTVEKGLLEMNTSIEKIPTGMVKERYVGGIAHFYNIIYLMKMTVGLTT
jgi:hypothetical protein